MEGAAKGWEVSRIPSFQTSFQATRPMCNLMCNPHISECRPGSSALPFQITDRRESREVKQPPQGHTAHYSKVLTNQGKATQRLFLVLSFLISNPGINPGLSGFTEGRARWLGPWKSSARHREEWRGLFSRARDTWEGPFPQSRACLPHLFFPTP